MTAAETLPQSSNFRPVLLVAGARPNFMKIAPIWRALKRANRTAILVHTGQHYDAELSTAFFTDLDLPTPHFSLGVGSGTHAEQTARVMEPFEKILLSTRPGWVVVVGDVNSTLAAALVTGKLRYQLDTRLAHVEAGLRSHDWRMPEEMNRVLTDRLSDLLLTPSPDARENLLLEGIGEEKIVFVGNVMIDTLLAELPRARALEIPSQLGLVHGEYAVATLHRPSNVDDPYALRRALHGLSEIAATQPVVAPLHPRTLAQLDTSDFSDLTSRIRIVRPLPYLEMLSLLDGAGLILTDSGGLQEEATVLGVPCVTLREQTERPITITHGTNRLAPWPLTVGGIVSAAAAARAGGRVPVGSKSPPGWDGKAAERVAAALT